MKAPQTAWTVNTLPDLLFHAAREAEFLKTRTEQLRFEFATFVEAMDSMCCFDTAEQCRAMARAKSVLAAYPNIADREVAKRSPPDAHPTAPQKGQTQQ